MKTGGVLLEYGREKREGGLSRNQAPHSNSGRLMRYSLRETNSHEKV